jgi:stearoyl-CoA desaturase (Delta-9 desaturase)
MLDFDGIFLPIVTLQQLLAMKRVGVLHGGAPHGTEDKVVPPSQRFKIARYNELSSAYGSSTAYSDGEGILG